jgi:hypothetical protein
MASEEFNPYAAPGATVGREAESNCYRLDYRRLSYRELWQISQGVTVFVFLAVYKTLHLPLRLIAPNPIARITTLDFVEPEQVPSEVWDLWRDALTALDEFGFNLNFVIRIPTMNPGELNFTACYLCDDEMTGAGCAYSHTPSNLQASAIAGYSISTLLSDGRFATTHTGPRGLYAPHIFLENPLNGGSPPRLLEAHREWVATLGISAVRLERGKQADHILNNWKKEYEYHASRKIYVAVPASECESFLRQIESTPSAPQVQFTPLELKLCLTLLVLMLLTGILWLLGFSWPSLRGTPFRVLLASMLLLLAFLSIRRRRSLARLNQPSPDSTEEL